MEKQRENKNPCGYCGFRYTERDADAGASAGAAVAPGCVRSLRAERNPERQLRTGFELPGSRKPSDSLFETGLPSTFRHETASTPVTIRLASLSLNESTFIPGRFQRRPISEPG